MGRRYVGIFLVICILMGVASGCNKNKEEGATVEVSSTPGKTQDSTFMGSPTPDITNGAGNTSSSNETFTATPSASSTTAPNTTSKNEETKVPTATKKPTATKMPEVTPKPTSTIKPAPVVEYKGLSWPKGQVLPSFANANSQLDAINIISKGSADRAMLSAFCGVINKRQPRVMLYTTQGVNEKWPKLVGLNYKVTKNEQDIILKYKKEIKGLIVWDRKVPDTLNLATTLAGTKDALVVNEKQLEIYSKGDFSYPIIEDYRGKFKNKVEVYNYLYDNLWDDCSKRLIVGIRATGDGIWELRDLAVAAKTAAIWLDPTKSSEKSLLKKFFSDCTPAETYYIGWWTSEGDGVGVGSQYSIPTIPADYYYNYSIYSGTSRELDIPIVPAKPKLENKYYISFTLSDGDNLQYVQHAMKTAPQLWSNKNRGKYPINWTCSPLLLDAGPQILNFFYKTATENDFLISGPSGLGYTYPTDWGKNTAGMDALKKYTINTNSYFERTAFNMITVWNFITEEQASIYARNIRSMVGFSVQERYNGQPHQYIVDGRIPLVTTSPRYDGDTNRVLELIERDIDNWDGQSPAFQMPQLISWGCGVPDVIKIASALEDKYGDKVSFVRGDHLMMLYSEAYGAPYNLILQSKNVSASGSDQNFNVSKIVDGSFAKDKGWQCSSNGDKWVVFDLKGQHTISRYVLKNAGAGYYDKKFNTKAFKIQTSMDGKSWTNIDTVTNNTSNIVDKDFPKTKARYLRLYITNPGADGTARVQEFSVF